MFTSYGGLEIKLIVRNFKLQSGGSSKVMLSRYPVNIYRDDEMKTLFQGYAHQCITAAVNKGCKGESLPAIGSKGNSVCSFASGNNFNYGFSSGKTPTVDMNSIVKQEKGSSAFKKSSDSARVGVKSKLTKSPKNKAGKGAGLAAQSKAIMKSKAAGKKSTARPKTGMTPGAMATPGGKKSSHTPNITKSQIQKMKEWIKKKK